MFKHIDAPTKEVVEGFCYTNIHGTEESVEYTGGFTNKTVRINCGDSRQIYLADIPKVIKALQMAYDYKQQA
jgi:hypothetical protein